MPSGILTDDGNVEIIGRDLREREGRAALPGAVRSVVGIKGGVVSGC